MVKVLGVVALLLLAGCATTTTPRATTQAPSSEAPSSTAPASTASPPLPPGSPPASSPSSQQPISWHLDANQTWVSSGAPPACPEPLSLQLPVDLDNVTGILYPGQVRGNAFKGHGGFRLDGQPDNNVTVRIPFDAYIVRGTHAVRNGTNIDSTTGLEEQDGFEFIAPCGIMYTFGHLRHLTPEFQAVADSLPLVVGFNRTQYYDVDPPVFVHAGEVLATAVGFETGHNVFFDFALLDVFTSLNGANGWSVGAWSANTEILESLN